MPAFLVLLLMQVTVFSSIAAILILAVKQIFKCRIPPAIGMFMWVVLLARLLCPIFPESEVSIYNFVPVGRSIMFSLTHDISSEMKQMEEARFDTANPYVFELPETEPVEDKPEKTENMSLGSYLSNVVMEGGRGAAQQFDTAILLLYGIGVTVTLCYQFTVYRRAKEAAVFRSNPCRDRDMVELYYRTALNLGIPPKRIPVLREGNTSMLVGILRPVVIARQGMSENEAEMVFAHELTHFRNGDNPILLFSTAVCCMFWYNPLMWIVRSKLREDIELLCDARTLANCGIESTEYALMLCRNSAFGELSLGAGVAMSATGRRLKTRLKTISIQKKHHYLPRAASFLLCLAIMMVCLTNPIISQSTEYTAFIDNYTALTGESEREIHLDERVSVHEFLTQVDTLLAETGGDSLRMAAGGGSLELLKRMAAESPTLSEDVKRTVSQLKNDTSLSVKDCAVLVDCLTDLLTEGSRGVEADLPLLPEMIAVEEFNRVLSALTPEEGERLKSCYNRGVRGADVEFDYLYTNAMMELINQRINNDWMRAKIHGFYLEVDVSPEELDTVSDWINDQVRYVGVGTKFFICSPDINRNEKALLREIIGAARAGEREDVYYLKGCEDNCSFSEAETLFRKAGYTLSEMFEGYAELGFTLYSCISGDETAMVSEYDFQRITERLEDDGLIARFREVYDYYEDFTYSDSRGQDVTYNFGYYVLNPEKTEEGRAVMTEITDRMNRRVMPKLCTVDQLTLVGVAEDGVREAYLRGVELGIFQPEEDTVYFSDKLGCGEALRIAYKLRACLVNGN